MDRTAVIIPVRLPGSLERIRRRNIAEAGAGLPAHVTLLYPFVAASELQPGHREKLAATLHGLEAFDYRLTSIGGWPGVVYVAPKPRAPFYRVAGALARDWPDYPPYGGDFPFEPHVTVAEPADAPVLAEARAAARSTLPAACRAAAAVLIVEDATGRWRTRWRFPFRSIDAPRG
jgi:2'-5' RNA ligase